MSRADDWREEPGDRAWCGARGSVLSEWEKSAEEIPARDSPLRAHAAGDADRARGYARWLLVLSAPVVSPAELCLLVEKPPPTSGTPGFSSRSRRGGVVASLVSVGMRSRPDPSRVPEPVRHLTMPAGVGAVARDEGSVEKFSRMLEDGDGNAPARALVHGRAPLPLLSVLVRYFWKSWWERWEVLLRRCCPTQSCYRSAGMVFVRVPDGSGLS